MRMYDLPDERGHFGPYGGVFVAETLSQASRLPLSRHEPERHERQNCHDANNSQQLRVVLFHTGVPAVLA